ncbi:MAG TPA: hypothetical protein VGT41_03530 [Candidatus Babeliales bacterium]|nr:hypothetical protein [Candidatus Babeliales bacterium]
MMVRNILIFLLFFSVWVYAGKNDSSNSFELRGAVIDSEKDNNKPDRNGVPQTPGFYYKVGPRSNDSSYHGSSISRNSMRKIAASHKIDTRNFSLRDLAFQKLSWAEINRCVSQYYDASTDAVVVFNPLYLTHAPRACANWTVQTYWEGLRVLSARRFLLDQNVDLPPEYKYFGKNSQYKMYVHDGDRHWIAQQWPLYDYPAFWEFLKQYPDYEHCILAAQNLINRNESVRDQLSAQAREKIAAQATRITECYKAAHAHAIQEQHEREEQARLAAQKQQEEYEEKLLREEVKKQEEIRQLEMIQDQLRMQYTCLESQCGDKNRLQHLRNGFVAVQTVINGNDVSILVIRELNNNAIDILQDLDIDAQEFTRCFGNAIATAKHEEIIDITNTFGELSIQPNLHKISSIMCGFANSAQICNKSGDVKEANAIADFCWDMLEYSQAFAGGIFDGLKAIGNSVIHADQTIQHIASACTRAVTFIEDIMMHAEYFSDECETHMLAQCMGIEHKDPRGEIEKYTEKLVRMGDALEAAGHRFNNKSGPEKIRICTSLGVELCLTPVVYDKLFCGAGLLCRAVSPYVKEALQRLPNSVPAEHLLMCAEGGSEVEVALEATKMFEKAAEAESKIAGIAGGGKNIGNFITKEAAYTLLEESQELHQLERIIERLRQTADKNIFKTHYSPANSTKIEAIEAKAESLYALIRETANDINRVSENTGLSQKIVKKVKEHVFFDEHILFNEIKRFAPDIDMAEAWTRLADNKFVQADLSWLLHEYAESILMKGQQMNWRSAHDIINQFYNWEILIQ